MVAAAGAAGAPGSFGGLRFASAFNSPVEGSRCQKIPESSTRGFGNFCLDASWGQTCLSNEARVSTSTSKLATRTQQSLLNLRGLASHQQQSRASVVLILNSAKGTPSAQRKLERLYSTKCEANCVTASQPRR